jgi:hypothetical protein
VDRLNQGIEAPAIHDAQPPLEQRRSPPSPNVLASGPSFPAAAVAAPSTGSTPSAAAAAVLRIGLQVAASAIPTIVIATPAIAPSLNTGSTLAAREIACAAVLVRFHDSAARITARQFGGTFLRAAAAIGVVRRQVSANTAATALPGLATDAVAAVGVFRADLAVRAARLRIRVGVDAETAAICQILRTGAEATARLVFVAHRASAAASIGVFAACLTNKATRARCSFAMPCSDADTNRNCGKSAHRRATSRRRPNRPCDIIKLLTIHQFKLPALYP